ncbi:MAG: uncharacterized protein KVP18_001591 [Porospora cf. gigantea A]|uniref:uncharacterized protein n=1 Tax=Porospora cf. gigantea A TaxID=2853593 RepID=UPI00355A9269|nr:MAG: hypothetical protein KVP18_001591 [Porospora cf. gigantea A]
MLSLDFDDVSRPIPLNESDRNSWLERRFQDFNAELRMTPSPIPRSPQRSSSLTVFPVQGRVQLPTDRTSDEISIVMTTSGVSSIDTTTDSGVIPVPPVTPIDSPSDVPTRPPRPSPVRSPMRSPMHFTYPPTSAGRDSWLERRLQDFDVELRMTPSPIPRSPHWIQSFDSEITFVERTDVDDSVSPFSLDTEPRTPVLEDEIHMTEIKRLHMSDGETDHFMTPPAPSKSSPPVHLSTQTLVRLPNTMTLSIGPEMKLPSAQEAGTTAGREPTTGASSVEEPTAYKNLDQRTRPRLFASSSSIEEPASPTALLLAPSEPLYDVPTSLYDVPRPSAERSQMSPAANAHGHVMSWDMSSTFVPISRATRTLHDASPDSGLDSPNILTSLGGHELPTGADGYLQPRGAYDIPGALSGHSRSHQPPPLPDTPPPSSRSRRPVGFGSLSSVTASLSDLDSLEAARDSDVDMTGTYGEEALGVDIVDLTQFGKQRPKDNQRGETDMDIERLAADIQHDRDAEDQCLVELERDVKAEDRYRQKITVINKLMTKATTENNTKEVLRLVKLLQFCRGKITEAQKAKRH